ncbi:hypothetical protein BGZ57DRAFT_1001441 [Hyaloscypha finlandica]|nr:hypothetical protein BGZ57DRAFT_1001441 [Hyaloscypha finlandica]
MASNSTLALALAMSSMALTTTPPTPPCPPNRPNSTWAQHMSLPLDCRYNASRFTLFPQLPLEVRGIIWKFSSSAAEIISVEVIRPIISEKGTNKKKKVDGQMIRRQFSIKYKAFGIPLTLGGTYVTRLDGIQFVRSGQLGACKESRAIYLKAKPNFVRLFKQNGGGNIWFNADIDTIAIPRRTRFNLNQLRQRRRPKMVFFRGFENIRRVVFEKETDEETALGLLGDQIAIKFAESIVDIEEQLFEGPSARFSKDTAWTDAVVLEQVELGKEMKRAGEALHKVNGTVFKEGVGEGVKMHFFPLGENYLED